MNRKNQVLDTIGYIHDELNRLYQLIPEDTNQQFNVWLGIINRLKERLDNLSNLVELEDD